jgi:hypothetical protein
MYFCLQFYHRVKTIISSPNINLKEKLTQFGQIFSSGIIYWPKFVYLISLPFLLIFGLSIESIKYSNLIFLWILIFSTYWITLRITKDSFTAIIASLLIGTYPLIFESSRQYGLDFPLTSWVTLVFLWLLKTKQFKKTFSSIFLGIIIGIGTLIKGQIVFFISIPLIFTLLLFLTRIFIIYLKRRKFYFISLFIRLINFVICLTMAISIGSFWWKGKLNAVKASLQEHTSSKIAIHSIPHVTVGTFQFYAFYLLHLFKSGIGPIFFILCLVSWFSLFRKSCYSRYIKILLILWLLIPILVFSFVFYTKQLRYIMPILPAIAISISLFISTMKSPLWRRSFVNLILIFSFFQYIILNLPQKRFLEIKRIFQPIVRNTLYGNIYFENSPPEYKIALNVVKTLKKKNSKLKKYSIGIIRAVPLGPMDIQLWIYFYGLKNGINFKISEIIEQYYDFFNTLPPYLLTLFPEDNISWPEDKRFFILLEKSSPNYYDTVILPSWSRNIEKLKKYKHDLTIITDKIIDGVYVKLYKLKGKNNENSIN